MAGRPAIFANGTPAPLVASFATSRSFCRSVNAINAYDMTLAAGCLFQRWDILCGGGGGQSIEGIHGRGEDEQEFWKRSEGEGDEWSDLKGENTSFPQNFTIP
jgi:hypothetical protein